MTRRTTVAFLLFVGVISVWSVTADARVAEDLDRKLESFRSVLEESPSAEHLQRLKADCATGENESCVEFGDLHRDGLGVERAPSKALVLYQLACARGSESGCVKRDRLYADITRYVPSLGRYLAFHFMLLSGFAIWLFGRRSRLHALGPMLVEKAHELRAVENRVAAFAGWAMFACLTVAPFLLSPLLTAIFPAQIPIYLASLMGAAQIAGYPRAQEGEGWRLPTAAGVALAIHLGSIAVFSVFAGVLTGALGAEGLVRVSLYLFGAGAGIATAVAGIFIAAPMLGRIAYPTDRLRDTVSTAKLRRVFRSAGMRSPEFLIARRETPLATLAGTRGGWGPMHSAFFISPAVLRALTRPELIAIAAHDAGAHALGHWGMLWRTGVACFAGASLLAIGLEALVQSGGIVGGAFLISMIPAGFVVVVRRARRLSFEADGFAIAALRVEPEVLCSALAKLETLEGNEDGNPAIENRIARIRAKFTDATRGVAEEPVIAA